MPYQEELEIDAGHVPGNGLINDSLALAEREFEIKHSGAFGFTGRNGASKSSTIPHGSTPRKISCS